MNDTILFLIITYGNLNNLNNTLKSIIVNNSGNCKIFVACDKNEIESELSCYDKIEFIDLNNRKNTKKILENEEYKFITIIQEGNEYINIDFSQIIKLDADLVNINSKQKHLSKNFNYISNILDTYFINKKLFVAALNNIENVYFFHNDLYLLLELFLKKTTRIFLLKFKILIRSNYEVSKENLLEEYQKQWYTEFLDIYNEIFKKLNYYKIKCDDIEYSFLLTIQTLFSRNENTKNKQVLNKNESEKFMDSIIEILKNISDDKISDISNKLYVLYLLNNKYNNLKKPFYNRYNDVLYLLYRNQIIDQSNKNNIRILLMEYKENSLIIFGNIKFSILEDKIRIYASYNNQKYYASKIDLTTKIKVFGEDICSTYNFKIIVPLVDIDEEKMVKFFIETGFGSISSNINFVRPLSRLTKMRYAYWECGNFTIKYYKPGLLIKRNTKLEHLKREVLYVLSLLIRNKDAFLIRMLYNFTKPIYKNRKIWLFEDKIYKGGDNGEYLYRYCLSQNDGYEKYYVLKKDCDDAKRFKNEGIKFLKYGSIKHHLLFLNSDIVFSTHNGVPSHHDFGKEREKFFRGIYNSYNICIQHGLTVQNIPHLTNKINDNIQLYMLASNVEKINIMENGFAYNGDELKITGCPRYDGLKNNDKRQILITPSWRNYLAVPVVNIEETRDKNSDFKESIYFKIYNNLINDKEFINCAKKNNYKIVYLLHPCTSSQIDDFDKNEYVELVAATDNMNYEKILTESSLMVTDYSGVQFDFAYMYKPILYYQPNELPPSYDEGAYKYDSMSLGKIIKDHKTLIKELCKYMENDCKLEVQYKKRIDEFFEYHDYNNCKRIYDEVLENEKKRNKKNN